MITCHCRLKMSQLFIVSDFREKIVPRINNAIVEAMNSAPMTSSCWTKWAWTITESEKFSKSCRLFWLKFAFLTLQNLWVTVKCFDTVSLLLLIFTRFSKLTQETFDPWEGKDYRTIKQQRPIYHLITLMHTWRSAANRFEYFKRRHRKFPFRTLIVAKHFLTHFPLSLNLSASQSLRALKSVFSFNVRRIVVRGETVICCLRELINFPWFSFLANKLIEAQFTIHKTISISKFIDFFNSLLRFPVKNTSAELNVYPLTLKWIENETQIRRSENLFSRGKR